MMRLLSRLLAALALIVLAAPALAQQYAVANHAIPLGRGTNVSAFNALAGATAGRVLLDQGASADPAYAVMSGDCGITSAGVVTCSKANGVAMPSSGTSGGIPYYSSTSAVGSSAALAANQIVVGGGSGTAPATLGSLGTTTTLLHGNASGAPSFGSVVSGDLNITGTTCTNQFVSAISSAAAGTCTTDTLAGAQHANQGTTTTVLHGNAAGNPSWGSVAIGSDVSGLGTGIATALGVNTGSAGAPVLFNGAGGTPSSLTLTNATGLPVSGITASTSTALGVGSIELGNASDTTLSRSAAGQLAVEGVDVDTVSNTKTLSNKTLASPVATGVVDNQGTLKLSSFVTSTQITTNQNDYTATDGSNTCSTKGTLRLNSNASLNVTGLSCGQAEGDIRILHNVGTSNIVLTNQDVSSTAANRFLFGGDFTLLPDNSITIRYDGTASRWRALVSPGAGGGGGGGVSSVAIAAGTGISTSGTCTITTSGTCTVGLSTPVSVANGGTGSSSLTANNVLLGNGTSAVQVVAPSTARNILASDGTTWAARQQITLGTAVSPSSVTSVLFSSLPTGLRRINLLFSQVPVSGTSPMLVQVGSGSVTSTGYVGNGARNVSSASPNITGYTNGLSSNASSASTYTGIVTLQLLDPSANTWVMTMNLSDTSNTFQNVAMATVTLSGSLDRVNITTVSGSGVINGGKINISYE